MTATPAPQNRHMETIAGLMASAAIFFALMGLAWRPVRLTPLAALLALVAVGIGGRNNRLAAAALWFAGGCWVVGVTVAILTGHPLY